MSAKQATSITTKRIPKKTPDSDAGKTPSELIDARIRELADWRGALLARIRTLMAAAHPDITEEWKWNTPAWSCSGILCTGETYKMVVKLTFARGAAIADPSGLFNSSMDGNVRRAIDIAEGAHLDEAALTALVQSAVALNKSSSASKAGSAP